MPRFAAFIKMTIDWQNGKTTIARLRFKCAGIDSISARLRTTSLLNAAQVHSAGLLPAAVVFIRKLRAPTLSVRQLQRSTHPPLGWEQALTASVDHLIKHAARPALGAVPLNTEAVVFLDRAELLACLASDWCDDTLITR